MLKFCWEGPTVAGQKFDLTTCWGEFCSPSEGAGAIACGQQEKSRQHPSTEMVRKCSPPFSVQKFDPTMCLGDFCSLSEGAGAIVRWRQ